MYIVNDNGVNRNTLTKYQFLQMILISFPLIGYICFNFYLYRKDIHSGNMFFFISVLPYFTLLLIVFSFSIFRKMRRWNRTIRILDLNNGTITTSTFPTACLKSKEYTILLSEINLKKSMFKWYGKDKKEGITITTNSGIELFLVKDYFDEYNIILNKLNMQ